MDGPWTRTLGGGGTGFFQGELGGPSADVGHLGKETRVLRVSRGPWKRCVEACGVTVSVRQLVVEIGIGMWMREKFEKESSRVETGNW